MGEFSLMNRTFCWLRVGFIQRWTLRWRRSKQVRRGILPIKKFITSGNRDVSLILSATKAVGLATVVCTYPWASRQTLYDFLLNLLDIAWLGDVPHNFDWRESKCKQYHHVLCNYGSCLEIGNNYWKGIELHRMHSILKLWEYKIFQCIFCLQTWYMLKYIFSAGKILLTSQYGVISAGICWMEIYFALW